jgi:hypothetical protein
MAHRCAGVSQGLSRRANLACRVGRDRSSDQRRQRRSAHSQVDARWGLGFAPTRKIPPRRNHSNNCSCISLSLRQAAGAGKLAWGPGGGEGHAGGHFSCSCPRQRLRCACLVPRSSWMPLHLGRRNAAPAPCLPVLTGTSVSGPLFDATAQGVASTQTIERPRFRSNRFFAAGGLGHSHEAGSAQGGTAVEGRVEGEEAV